ncbi:MAG: hypothetical protein M1831_002427 [Alyxoria varia]|nr:MAG: hypothetical protein M1831_002427 [Alyxoria varia]
MYALVLLPSPPDPATSPTISAAFKKPLDAVFKDVAQENTASSGPAKIDIVIPSAKGQCFSRARHFGKVGKIIARTYSLVSSLFGQRGLSLEGPKAMDVNILPLAWDPGHEYTISSESSQRRLDCLVGLPALVASQRPWDRLFIVDGEKGYRLYRQFRELTVHRKGEGPLQSLSSAPTTIPGGLVLHNPSSTQATRHLIRREAHRQVMTVGAFNNLGFEQKLLLTMAAFLVEPPQPARDFDDLPLDPKLLVGIVDDSKDSSDAPVENRPPYQNRKAAVASFFDAVTNFRPPASDSFGSTGSSDVGRSRDALMIYDYERITAPSDLAANNELLTAAVLPAGLIASDVTVEQSRLAKGWNPLESFSMDEIGGSQDDEDDL